MKLSDLSPAEQERIVKDRQQATEALQHYALRSGDSIALAWAELHAQALLTGVNPDFCEDVDTEEDL